MKILILFSFLLFLGCEVKYDYASKDENLSIQDSFLEDLSIRHLQYWDSFSKKDFDQTYKLEIPYQQFINTKQWYKNFYKDTSQYYRVVQKKIILLSNKHAVVETVYINKKNSHLFQDHWYYIDKMWYHQFLITKLP